MSFSAKGLNPYVFDFARLNQSCDKQSNALKRSVSGAPNASSLSGDNFHFLNTANRQVWTQKPLRSPHRNFDSNGFIKFAVCLVIIKTFEVIGEMLTGRKFSTIYGFLVTNVYWEAFSLKTLTGTSVLCTTFLAFNLLDSL